MNFNGKVTSFFLLLCIPLMAVVVFSCCGPKEPMAHKQTVHNSRQSKMVVYIIMGSTRQGRLSEKIAKAVKDIADTRPEITAEIIDLRDYKIPFLEDEVTPDSRVVFTNAAVKTWSQKIEAADGFIIVVPEYNAGYPGVLKNSLDSLYKEWNHKPVAFIGYSGGPAGGANAVAQLRNVVQALAMSLVSPQINIPHAWNVIDKNGNANLLAYGESIKNMIDQLVTHKSKQ